MARMYFGRSNTPFTSYYKATLNHESPNSFQFKPRLYVTRHNGGYTINYDGLRKNGESAIDIDVLYHSPYKALNQNCFIRFGSGIDKWKKDQIIKSLGFSSLDFVRNKEAKYFEAGIRFLDGLKRLMKNGTIRPFMAVETVECEQNTEFRIVRSRQVNVDAPTEGDHMGFEGRSSYDYFPVVAVIPLFQRAFSSLGYIITPLGDSADYPPKGCGQSGQPGFYIIRKNKQFIIWFIGVAGYRERVGCVAKLDRAADVARTWFMKKLFENSNGVVNSAQAKVLKLRPKELSIEESVRIIEEADHELRKLAQEDLSSLVGLLKDKGHCSPYYSLPDLMSVSPRVAVQIFKNVMEMKNACNE